MNTVSPRAVHPMKDNPVVINMEPRGDIDSPSNLDPQSLGFMCGLEIHQQLDTGKLHSRMPSQLFDFSLAEIPDYWTRSERNVTPEHDNDGKIHLTPLYEKPGKRT